MPIDLDQTTHLPEGNPFLPGDEVTILIQEGQAMVYWQDPDTQQEAEVELPESHSLIVNMTDYFSPRYGVYGHVIIDSEQYGATFEVLEHSRLPGRAMRLKAIYTHGWYA